MKEIEITVKVFDSSFACGKDLILGTLPPLSNFLSLFSKSVASFTPLSVLLLILTPLEFGVALKLLSFLSTLSALSSSKSSALSSSFKRALNSSSVSCLLSIFIPPI